MEFRARRLARDAEDRNAIGNRRVEAGHHIRSGGTRRTQIDADLAGASATVALGCVRPAFFMANEDVANRALLERFVERQNRRTRNAEHEFHTLTLQNMDRRFHRCHFWHARLPRRRIVYSIPYRPILAGASAAVKASENRPYAETALAHGGV